LAGGTTRTARLLFRYWLPLVAYVAVIFSLSAQPYLRPPLHFQNSDKVMHLFEYGVLGALLFRVVRAQGWGRRRDVAAFIVLLGGMAIGAADERFQAFIPGRSSDVMDWLVDSLGVGLAQALSMAWTEWREG
jgi:VanZ family protein